MRSKELFQEVCDLSKFFPKRPLKTDMRGEAFILDFLFHNNDREVTAGELTEKSGVSSARVSALLKRLEAQGLLERKQNPLDLRITFVKLTDAGLEYIGIKHKEVALYWDKVIKKVGEDDLKELVRIMTKIGTAINELEEERNESSV